jgi:hypothetical protein
MSLADNAHGWEQIASLPSHTESALFLRLHVPRIGSCSLVIFRIRPTDGAVPPWGNLENIFAGKSAHLAQCGQSERAEHFAASRKKKATCIK